jgi:hypothetical protein
VEQNSTFGITSERFAAFSVSQSFDMVGAKVMEKLSCILAYHTQQCDWTRQGALKSIESGHD